MNDTLVLDLDKVRSILQDHNILAVSRKTGIHYNTLYRILSGKNTNPSLKTLRKLNEYITQERLKTLGQ